MAEGLLSSLFSTILGNLNTVALQQFRIASGLTTEIDTLKSTFTTIQAVLQDAEAKQWKSEAVRNWLRKLKGAAYDAEDILDEISTEALRRREVINQVSTFFSLRNPLVFHFKMGRKVKDIRERLDAIAEERSKFHLREGFAVDAQVGEMERRHTSSLINETEISGRNEDKEMIIEKLLNNLSDNDDLSVYAISGMGGLGKTTLAQLVYNDERVKGQFELKIWVCVSDDFDILRLTRAIIESIEGGPCNILELDPLQRGLQEKLRGKKFLLVLDDVWNEYHDKWDGLKEALRCGAKGSMVVVTTRIEKVALIMATLPVHHMGFLSEDDSWSLFRRRAFGIGRREENLQLETIGKAIVKKCGGLPLAVKALGSRMRLKNSEREWLFVKDSEIWNLADDGGAILPALRLSFDNLSSHSKRCFVYCSVFPKDCVMMKDMLIELWMANGFIPSIGQVDLNVMGHEIFNDLIWRSFFQDVEEDLEGVVTCKMHDLVHDLGQFIMGDECSIIGTGKVLKFPEEVRHLYFETWVPSQMMVSWRKDMLKLKSPRSLIFYNFTSLYISKQRYLRVLDLSSSSVNVVPKSIGKLIHLRYLDMSYCGIKNLPGSISSLQNLQTLKLRRCIMLEKLPKGMRYMRNLQCLDIRGCDRLVCMPAGMEQLTCLQTLSMFIVGPTDSGQQIGELKDLNLGGELTIKGVDNVRDSLDAKSANLRSKQNLISLSLCWRGNNKEAENAEEVLEGFQPHSNLKKLGISSYEGLQFPKWMLDSVLQNLVEIKLTDCGRCEHVPPLGKLPFLRVLDILGMDGIKYLNNEFYGDGENSFPALEKLYLEGMRNLEEWKSADRGESFPCLLELWVRNCPRLTELPRLPRLERLVIIGGNVMLFTQVTNLTSLSSLLIEDCSSLESLPEGLRNLNSLEYLSVFECDSLPSFPPNGLSCLKSLRVECCKKLECLSEGVQHLTALQELFIGECPEMKSFPEGMQNLTHLRTLEISVCEGLTSLPNSLGSLLSLSHLSVEVCHNMLALPDGLQSLKELRIIYCPEMKSLPNSLESLLSLVIQDCRNMISLPDGLQCLKELSIYDCPHLERRCNKEKGEDWPKIAHIPYICIDGQIIESISS